MKIRIFMLAIALVLVRANAQSLCTLVNDADAATFFGSKPDKRTDQAEMCRYAWKAQHVTLMVVNYVKASAKDRFNGTREGLKAAHMPIREELGLADQAFSSEQSNSIDMFLLKGGATVQITANNDRGEAIPAPLRDKLREVAKKAAARMR